MAGALERKGIRITAIDMADTPGYFDQKYHGLDKPRDYSGSIPDLEGRDANGTIHLGEAETDMAAENLDSQLINFSQWTMTTTRAQVPLHVIVPPDIRDQMISRIRNIGLGDRLGVNIHVWS